MNPVSWHRNNIYNTPYDTSRVHLTINNKITICGINIPVDMQALLDFSQDQIVTCERCKKQADRDETVNQYDFTMAYGFENEEQGEDRHDY